MTEDLHMELGRKERKAKTSRTHMLVATLIATITFAAGFTIPGGYKIKGPEEGMAVLVHNEGFRVFALANTIAVMCSTSSVLVYALATLYDHDEDKQANCYMKGFTLVLIAIFTMTVGFVSGTYAMLVHSLGLNIASLVILIIWFGIYASEAIGFCNYFKSQGQKNN